MSRFQWFHEAVLSAGYSVRDYSGRGMTGRMCLGVEIDEGSAFGFMADLLEVVDEDNVGELAKIVREGRMDSMGRGIIVYFPTIVWQDAWDDEDTDQDDDEEE